jgi:ACR3 family arsenite efflux pump ArsB
MMMILMMYPPLAKVCFEKLPIVLKDFKLLVLFLIETFGE